MGLYAYAKGDTVEFFGRNGICGQWSGMPLRLLETAAGIKRKKKRMPPRNTGNILFYLILSSYSSP